MVKNFRKSGLNSGVAVAALSLFAQSIPAYAQSQTFNFDIPSQDLGSALREFAKTSRQQVTFSSSSVGGKRSPNLRGTYTARAALDILLSGSGLAVESGRSGLFIVRPETKISPRSEQAGPSVAETGASESGEIVVTATRLDGRNLKVPTPTIPIAAATLQQGARPNLGSALVDLPQFKPSNTEKNSGGNFTAATYSIDIHGLGSGRTLTLLESRRLGGGGFANGGFDLALIPAVLVKKIDVVTSSASAAWGSGAVAGVVNIVLDGKLKGLRLGARTGISSRGDDAQYQFEGAYGADFADGRGHFIFGAEYADEKGIQPKLRRKNTGGFRVVDNPASTSTNGIAPLIIAPNVGIGNVSPGGLILTGVNTGRTFNPDGTLRTYNRGRLTGGGTVCVGCENPSLDNTAALIAPNTRIATLGRVTYEISDSLRITAEGRYAKAYNRYNLLPDNDTNLTIFVDNAFLPAAVRSQMAGSGETQFTMGRFNQDYAFIDRAYKRENISGTIQLDGNIGEKWRWTGYYTYSQIRENTDLSRVRIAANLARAVDSVINPATGQPVCRVNIDSNPNNNDASCVPINLFGVGSPSEAARNYIYGNSLSHSLNKLHIGSVSLRGEPFSTWAGEVSVAVGAEARREIQDTRVGPLDIAGVFTPTSTFFPLPFAAKQTTTEGFAEVLIPLAADVPLLQRLDFNAAARVTDDRTGSVWSWKLGLTDDVVDGLILRASHSKDILAPSLRALLGNPSVSFVNITDPANGNQPILVQSLVGGGNANLKPEKSKSTTFGATFAPRFLPRFRASIDYYDIRIGNALGGISAQDLVTRCFNGETNLCGNITRANGQLTGIVSGTINLLKVKARGIDATADYSLPIESLFGARAQIRLANSLTRVLTNKSSNGAVVTDTLTSQGSLASGLPKWRVNSSIFVETDLVQGNIRARYISAGVYDSLRNIANNRIPSYIYFDAGINFKIPMNGTEFNIYGQINNLFDKDPPIESRNSVYYDVVGRYFSIGARLKL